MSRLFIYYNARVRGGHSGTVADTGCSMTDAIESLEELGTCLESIWPYDISRVNTRPSEEAYEQAKDYTISEALRVDIDLNEMKSCLAQGFPFAFGLLLFSSCVVSLLHSHHARISHSQPCFSSTSFIPWFMASAVSWLRDPTKFVPWSQRSFLQTPRRQKNL